MPARPVFRARRNAFIDRILRSAYAKGAALDLCLLVKRAESCGSIDDEEDRAPPLVLPEGATAAVASHAKTPFSYEKSYENMTEQAPSALVAGPLNRPGVPGDRAYVECDW